MRLKVSSITNLTDARFFSAIGADYLGFCFDVLNENNISIAKAKEITGWLHQPAVVGEFDRHQSKEEIQFIAEEMNLNEIQVPFLHPEKQALDFDKFLTVEDWKILPFVTFTDSLVLKITEADINDQALKGILASNRVFIETSFNKENILKIIEQLQPFGIQITCQREEKAGWSMVDEYAEILEMIGFS